MSMGEWYVEAQMNVQQTPEGRAMTKRDEWMQAAEMTDEEWRATYGTPKN